MFPEGQVRQERGASRREYLADRRAHLGWGSLYSSRTETNNHY
jgi:hypothetical protein